MPHQLTTTNNLKATPPYGKPEPGRGTAPSSLDAFATWSHEGCKLILRIRSEGARARAGDGGHGAVLTGRRRWVGQAALADRR